MRLLDDNELSGVSVWVLLVEYGGYSERNPAHFSPVGVFSSDALARHYRDNRYPSPEYETEIEAFVIDKV